MKSLLRTGAISMLALLAACERPADVASRNISYAADRFEIRRRIVFINGITDKYLLSVEGLCSLGNFDPQRELSVTCKVGPNSFKKHFLGLSQNVTYVSEQIEGADVSTWHYKVVFRPETILPAIDAEVK